MQEQDKQVPELEYYQVAETSLLNYTLTIISKLKEGWTLDTSEDNNCPVCLGFLFTCKLQRWVDKNKVRKSKY